MAGTSRIDELRKKFDENPRRYFAPLANEYRKIGDFEQAIFICQEFLPQQPGHMSGHIVYGQALFESGRHDEARSVFETALALDPENLIALRHLGDIARARGDSDTARAWYRRVLESDPRNEEIAGILTSLDSDSSATPQQQAPPATTTASSNEPIAVESAISAATAGESRAPAAAADPIVTDSLTSAPAESSFDDIAKLFTAPTAASASPADASLGLVHEGEDLIGSAGASAQSSAGQNAPLDEQIEKEEPPLGDPVPAVAEPAPPSTFNLPFLEGLTNSEPAPPAAVVAPPAPVPDASTAFVTETMAELYIKQGHRDQALDVYRQLVRLHPNDSALAARLRELEGGTERQQKSAPPPVQEVEAIADAGPTIREFLGSIAEFRPGMAGSRGSIPVVPEQPADLARPNEPARNSGQTVSGSISSLFAGAEKDASVPQQPLPDLGDFATPRSDNDAGYGATLPGRPSKPAATELSLDHVFRHATPASGSGAHSSFSFDQFFSQQAQQDVAASDAEPSGQESAGLSDDIQQFNAWLEGLKKT